MYRAVVIVMIAVLPGTGCRQLFGFERPVTTDAAAIDAPEIDPVTFAAPIVHATGVQPIGLAGGKLSDDDFPELVVTSYQEFEATVFSNSGGTLSRGPILQVGGSPNQPSAAAVGFFNGDNLGDVALVTYRNAATPNLFVFTNTGNGQTFSQSPALSTGNGPFAVTSAKIDQNDTEDIIVCALDGGQIIVRMNDGAGSFGAPIVIDVGITPQDIAVADFNNDTRSDVVVANKNGGAVSILVGLGTGEFDPPKVFSVGPQAYGVAAADFDGDGKLDVVATSRDEDRAYILFGNGDGSLDAGVPLPVGDQARGVRVGDFNSDGRSDFITVNVAANTATIYLGRGDGTFVGPQHIPTTEGPELVVVLDFDNDGRLDFAVNGMANDTISIQLNTTTK